MPGGRRPAGDVAEARGVRVPGVAVLVSIVVSIPACHAGDRGSIPRRGGKLSFLARCDPTGQATLASGGGAAWGALGSPREPLVPQPELRDAGAAARCPSAGPAPCPLVFPWGPRVRTSHPRQAAGSLAGWLMAGCGNGPAAGHPALRGSELQQGGRVVVSWVKCSWGGNLWSWPSSQAGGSVEQERPGRRVRSIVWQLVGPAEPWGGGRAEGEGQRARQKGGEGTGTDPAPRGKKGSGSPRRRVGAVQAVRRWWYSGEHSCLPSS